jgi:triphosphatase
VSAPAPRSTAPTVPVETELKLAVAPEAMARVARHPLLAPLRRGPSRRTRVTSTYFDTAGLDLALAGVSLRLRRDGRKWLQTVKGQAVKPAAGGMTARTEFEWPVTGGRLDPLRFATTPYRRTLGKAERRGLEPQFTSQVMRTTIPLAFADSTMALLCIDIGEVRAEVNGKSLAAPIHEIELELEAGDKARLYELASALAADIPLSLEPRSKAERGYALRNPPQLEPVRAGDVALPSDASLAQIEGNARGVIHDADPEWIHQMRIGVRRLRACLSLARLMLATARIEPLRVELRWLAHALGPARDSDVFTLETLPAFTAAVRSSGGAGVLRAELRALAGQADARRRDARALACAAVGSPRFLRLVLAAAALAETPVAGSPDPATLALPARQIARPLLKRRHRALLALGSDLAHAAPEARHAARLAAKKLRYATEFFAPLFPRPRTRAYRRALTALQEELGAWNDAKVAAELAGELAGAASPAAAAFNGWAAAQASARGDALDAMWLTFARARPFWTRD